MVLQASIALVRYRMLANSPIILEWKIEDSGVLLHKSTDHMYYRMQEEDAGLDEARPIDEAMMQQCSPHKWSSAMIGVAR